MKQGETKDIAWVIGETTAEIPLSALDQTISDLSKHFMFDKMIEKQTVLKDTGSIQIIHRVNKSNFMMPARDFVLSTSRSVLSTGEIVHTFFSVEIEECPEQDKITRS